MSKNANRKQNFLKTPKIVTLNKQQSTKFHKIRDLWTPTLGTHALYSKDQSKFILKTIPKNNSKQGFLTTTTHTYYQFPAPHSSKTNSYIFPLLGEPLSSFRVEQRWGKSVKNWVQRCGSIENALINVMMAVVENFENHGIGDILLQCYRVQDGRLVYCYDTWMKGTMAGLSQLVLQEQKPNLQEYLLSQSNLQTLSQIKSTKQPNLHNKPQNNLSNFYQKLCLLLLNLGVPELKSRNYQFYDYAYNTKNILQKIKFFKTKYSNMHLHQLIDRLWMNQEENISSLWKLFDSFSISKQNKSKSNCHSMSSSKISKFSKHELFSKTFCEFKENQLETKSSQKVYLQNYSSHNSSLNKNVHTSVLKEKNVKNITEGNSKVETPSLKVQKNRASQKLKLKDISTLYSENSKFFKNNQEASILDSKPCKEDRFDIKSIIVESISFHTSGSHQFERGQFIIMKLVEYLGLTQYLPQNLYEKTVLKICEEISVMPDWVYQSYPNGAIYFGQTSDSNQNKFSQKKQAMVRNGKGLYLFDSNDLYIGAWMNNSMHGQGVYIFKSGELYRGELSNGLKHGFGRFQYADKRIYEGYWNQNSKFGMGTVYFPNTVKFYGFFQKNCNTQGIFTRIVKKQAIKEMGCLQNYNWTDDKFNKNLQPKLHSHPKLQKCPIANYITEIDQTGNKYIGESRNGKKEGFGIMDGKEEVYQGNWRNGEEDGEGTLIVKGKFEIEGVWEDGMLVQMTL